ncbi:MAG: hypothetical protein ACTSQ4_05595 [Candidatus Heimdallarchaeaceae archaeon]
MRQSDTIKTLNQEIRKLKGELSQLQRARRVLKRKLEGVVV